MNRHLMVVLSLALAARAVMSAATPVVPVVVADVDDHPRYAFNYAVSDPLTRDNKAQWETRDGDAVKGSYQVVEPDGSLRVVDYASNHLTGFNAVVKNVLPNIHPSPVVPVVAPLAITAPIVTKTVTPLTSILGSLNYGFGAAPINVGPTVTSLGPWSLPWDPLTHSYGGWVPLSAPLLPLPIGPHATVFSKKYVNGRLYKWATGPIPLIGNRLVFKKKH